MAGTQETIQRRILDFRIVRDMACETFEAEAYQTNSDRLARKNRVVAEAHASRASKYRFVFRIPTMVDRDVFVPVTEIGVDTDVPDYPLKEPGTSILSSHVPWSPHFKQGLPVCIGGEFWGPKQGHVTLGHLALHLSRLLNWDEKGRGPGYAGWNGAAVAHHRDKYHGAPLNPDTVYPVLPAWLYGATARPMSFTFLGQQPLAAEFTFLG
jgi:hypothetical protein